MGILDEDVVRVRQSADIVAVVSQHTQLRKVGQRWSGLCPFHNEKSPSFSVNSTEGLFYCFGCHAKGDVITFVRDIEHLDFVGAIEWLAGKSGIQLRYTEKDETESRKKQNARYALMERAVDWYHDRLLSGADAGVARGYLRSRGFDREMVDRYRIGWAPERWDELTKSLKAPNDLLIDCGLGLVNRLGRTQDFFRSRVLFPIFDDQGRAVAFGGRKLPDAEGPKYQNSREGPLYNKSRVLYALNWAKADVVTAGEVVVCEGYTDVIGFFEAGVPRAVATCGTSLTEDHIRVLKRFTNRIVLAYDADEAGQAAAERVYEWEQRHEIEVMVLSLPPGTDPDELGRSDPAALAAAVRDARSFLGFRVARVLKAANLSSPEGRARAAAAAMDVIREHPDPMVRDQYVMEVTGPTRMEAEQLRTLLSQPAARRADRPATSDRPPAALPRIGRAGGTSAPFAAPGRHCRPIGPGVVPRGIDSSDLRRGGQRPIHLVLEDGEPAVVDLATRLAVEESSAEVSDVLVGLAVEAGKRAIGAMEAQARTSDDPLSYAPAIGGVKLMLEDVHGDEPSMDSLDRLLAWLTEHAVELEC